MVSEHIIERKNNDADSTGSNGLISVLNNFKVGQFIDSGKIHTTQTYLELLQFIFSI